MELFVQNSSSCDRAFIANLFDGFSIKSISSFHNGWKVSFFIDNFILLHLRRFHTSSIYFMGAFWRIDLGLTIFTIEQLSLVKPSLVRSPLYSDVISSDVIYSDVISSWPAFSTLQESFVDLANRAFRFGF